jgi:hypothetical protein
MCIAAAGPLAIAQFAVGAAGAVMNYQGQMAQYEAQQQQYQQNIKNARKAALDRYQSQQNQIRQERRKAEGELKETQEDALKARSTARVAAGEAGVSGLSVNQLVADFYGDEGDFLQRVEENYTTRRDAGRAEMKGTEAQAASRINSIPPPVKPSFAGTAVRVAGLGVKAFS